MPKIGSSNLIKLIITNVTPSEINLKGTTNLGTITTYTNLIINNSLLDSNYHPKINDILKIRANVEGISNNYRVTKIFKIEYPPPGYELGLKVTHDILNYYLFEIVDIKKGCYSGMRGYCSKIKINNLTPGSIYDFLGELENKSPVQYEGIRLDWEIVSITSFKSRLSITFSQNLPNLIDIPQTPTGIITDENGSNLPRTVVKYLIPGNRYCHILSNLNSIPGANTSLLSTTTIIPEGYVYTQDQMIRIWNELGGYGIIKQNDIRLI